MILDHNYQETKQERKKKKLDHPPAPPPLTSAPNSLVNRALNYNIVGPIDPLPKASIRAPNTGVERLPLAFLHYILITIK